ncbi:class A beta-lactamase-related serine hydrolase [Sphingomonas sp. LB-2]|uniref:class A beta-lactamase-related serine hydrolase n=1 Tax=Sphingomonas caeni TaxID=2984949 RepID=UPI0022301C5F|nr:class A beta-lactamase-related serine hydrolase [Sphingomonas caeni]MCW3848710.1 class A beta-lactamase-related serine hydrolase [Sphingomonas caeni]
MRSLFAWIAALTLAVLAPLPAPAQVAPAAPVASEQLKARIAELPGIVAGTGDFEGFFAPGFRAQVTKAQLAELTRSMIQSAGPVTRIESITPFSPWAAEFTLGFQNGRVTGKIAIDSNAPHQVIGLLFTGLSGPEKSLDEVLGVLRGLHGVTGYAIARLGEGAPQPMLGANAERPFAIGSAFKLIVLAELVRSIEAGERRWTDEVVLDGKLQIPGGAYIMSPAGTRVTLRELAAKMISVSDNSATDILIHTLGRERIEAMLPVVGVANPGGMRPLLTTLEMFKLKGIDRGEPGRQWLATAEAGRRAMLPALDAEPILAIDQSLFADGKPVMIGIEWYASPADMVRIMDWLRRHTESGPGAEARAILAINPGVPPAAAGKWRYVGFKGGSEPGVVSGTYLLQAMNGDWYVLSASWNDPDAAVDTGRFIGLLGSAVGFSAP